LGALDCRKLCNWCQSLKYPHPKKDPSKAPKLNQASVLSYFRQQARKALLNQLAVTGTLNETVFHDPHTNKPWKDEQAIRKNVWIPALKRASVKYCNSYQTRHTFASTMLSTVTNPCRLLRKWGIRIGCRSSGSMGDGFRNQNE
jgi:hypothetical protein